MNTDYGKWVLLASKGETKAANEILTKIKSNFPWDAERIEKELSVKIAKEFDSVEEYEKYLKMLDEDDYNLVEFLISNEIFSKVYNLIK